MEQSQHTGQHYPNPSLGKWDQPSHASCPRAACLPGPGIKPVCMPHGQRVRKRVRSGAGRGGGQACVGCLPRLAAVMGRMYTWTCVRLHPSIGPTRAPAPGGHPHFFPLRHCVLPTTSWPPRQASVGMAGTTVVALRTFDTNRLCTRHAESRIRRYQQAPTREGGEGGSEELSVTGRLVPLTSLHSLTNGLTSLTAVPGAPTALQALSQTACKCQISVCPSHVRARCSQQPPLA